MVRGGRVKNFLKLVFRGQILIFMCQRMTIDQNQHLIHVMSCGVIMLVVCVSGGRSWLLSTRQPAAQIPKLCAPLCSIHE
jgi:hypothetical protein